MFSVVKKLISSQTRIIKVHSRLIHSSYQNRLAKQPNDIRNHPKLHNECPVNSWNEWDTLEEVVVGRPEGSVIPKLTPEVKACMDPEDWWFFEKHADRYWSEVYQKDNEWEAVKSEIDELIRIFELEGVNVVQPEPEDFQRKFTTPTINEGSTGLYNSMPRDILLPVGNEIIVAPMLWRCRFFEYLSYQQMLMDYWRKGATWTIAPKPTYLKIKHGQTEHSLIREDFNLENSTRNTRDSLERVTTEAEPCWDAADFFRCGKDIFGQRSHTTNSIGIDWLRRHVASRGIRVHETSFYDAQAMHIDASLVPIRPGLLIKNPKYLWAEQEEILRGTGWEVWNAPRNMGLNSGKLFTCSTHIAINTLMLDQERILVERDLIELQKFYQFFGLKVIPCGMKHAFRLGGGFHCWTVDIRRKGGLQSYFNWSSSFIEKYEEKYCNVTK